MLAAESTREPRRVPAERRRRERFGLFRLEHVETGRDAVGSISIRIGRGAGEIAVDVTALEKLLHSRLLVRTESIGVVIICLRRLHGYRRPDEHCLSQPIIGTGDGN